MLIKSKRTRTKWKKNEELTSSCASSEPSLHNAPITTATTLTEGENSLDVLNFSTNHVSIEQLLVEPSLDLPSSQDDLLDFSCDKDDLPNHEHESTKPHASVEFTYVIHVASDTDEMKIVVFFTYLGLH